MSKPLGSHFGVGEFTTHFRTYFSGDWDVHWPNGLVFVLGNPCTCGFPFGVPLKPPVEGVFGFGFKGKPKRKATILRGLPKKRHTKMGGGLLPSSISDRQGHGEGTKHMFNTTFPFVPRCCRKDEESTLTPAWWHARRNVLSPSEVKDKATVWANVDGFPLPHVCSISFTSHGQLNSAIHFHPAELLVMKLCGARLTLGFCKGSQAERFPASQFRPFKNDDGT